LELTQELVLNNFRYRLIRPLGAPGFVAQAFLAQPLDFDLPGVPVVIKLPVNQKSTATEQLKEEAWIVNKLNRAEIPGWEMLPDAKSRCIESISTVEKRSIIAGIDQGETLHGRYCVIQELAPGEATLEPVSDPRSEMRTLGLTRRLAQVVGFVHNQGTALKDFLPQTKIDRVRVDWDGERIKNFKLIDWNISADPASSLDISNDLVFLGGLIFAFFTGCFLPLEERTERYDFPIVDVSTFVGATWSQLSEATRLLLKRLVNPLSTVRPSSATVVEEELLWLERLLRQQDVSPTQWVEMVHRDRDNAYHVLAIVATAKKDELPPRPREDLEYAERIARQTLDAEQERLIRNIEVDLRDGVFSQALSRLEEARARLDPSGAAARQANYRLQQALLGDTLRRQGVDARRDPGYNQVVAAIDALLEGNWPAANIALQMAPALHEYRPVQPLLAITEWRLQQEALETQIAEQRVSPQDADRRIEEAVALEQSRLETLEKIGERLRGWLAIAPFETELQTQALMLRTEIGQRKQFLEEWQDAIKKIDAGDETAAAEVGQRRLRFDSDDEWAKMLVKEATLTSRSRQRALELKALLADGSYSEVQELRLEP